VRNRRAFAGDRRGLPVHTEYALHVAWWAQEHTGGPTSTRDPRRRWMKG